MFDFKGFAIFLLPTVLTLLTTLVLLPWTKLFPRLSMRPTVEGRSLAIAALTLLAVLTSYLLSTYGQSSLVSLFLSANIISVAKLPLPAWLIFVGCFLFLDFLFYVVHYVLHRVPMFWRFHAIHHSDEHVTALSTFLHHPVELVISYVVLIVFAVVLGIPLVVIFVHGLLGAIHGAFTHADIAMPRSVDRVLRWIVITPDTHRTHHSVRMDEGNSNFGSMFIFWDVLFGTYVARPSVPEAELQMGLPSDACPTTFSALSLLLYPFKRR